MKSKIKNSKLWQTLFNVRPDELGTFILLSVYIFMVIGGTFVIGRTVSRALFLSSLPQEAIPYRYIGVTFGVVLASSLYARVAARYRRDRLIYISTGVMILGILLFRAALFFPWAENLLFLGGMFVFLEIAATLSIIQFWTLASEILNSREAKRLFSPIMAIGNLGGILGGAITSVTVALLGTQNLLFILVFMLAIAMLCVWQLSHRHNDMIHLPATKIKITDETPPQKTTFLDNLRELRNTPLLLSMAIIMVLITMVANIVDYQFDLSLQASFGSQKNELSAFLGDFFFWAGLAGFLVQITLTSTLMRRFGLAIALVVLPLASALGAGFILISGASLWAVTIARSSDTIFRYTVNDTAFSLLYMPISRDVRARIKVIIDGILKPVSIGAAGLSFLVVGSLSEISPVPWSFLVLLLVGAWFFVIRRIQKQYTLVLSQNVGNRRFDLERETIDINDETTVRVLAKTLNHADELQVLHALSLIRSIPHVDWDKYLIPLLKHPSPEIVQMVLEHLGREGNQEYGTVILDLLNSEIAETRAAAIQSYCKIYGSSAVPNVTQFLGDPDPIVQGGTIIGLITSGGLDGILHAAAPLKEMLTHEDPEMRVEGAKVLGILKAQQFYEPLIPLLEDDDINVQIQAIKAAGEVGAPSLLHNLLSKLSSRTTRRMTKEAIFAMGVDALPTLQEALENYDVDSQIHIYIPEILEKIGTKLAAEVLVKNIDYPNEKIHTEILKALAGIRSVCKFDIATETTHRLIETELEKYYELTLWYEDLGQDGRGILLDDSLLALRSRSLDRIFSLLALLYPAQEILSAHQAMSSESTVLRATAIDLIDNLVDRDIKALLLPIIEAPVEQCISIAETRFHMRSYSMEHRLEALASSNDPWLQACALFRIGQLKLSKLTNIVQAGLKHDNELVNESAIFASKLIA